METAAQEISIDFSPTKQHGLTGNLLTKVGDDSFVDEVKINRSDEREKYVDNLIKKFKGLKSQKTDMQDRIDKVAAGFVTNGELVRKKKAENGQAASAGQFIQCNERQLRDVAADAVNAILRANKPEPKYLTYGNAMVRIKTEGEIGTQRQYVRSEILTVDTTVHELARISDWKEMQIRGLIDCYPPSSVARDVLAFPKYPFPFLTGIVTAPTFTKSGKLVIAKGYDAESGLWHDQTISDLATVPTTPTQDEIKTAVANLLEPIQDFPFVSEADRTNAVAMMITPFAREIIDGVIPLWAFDAPLPGTGKTLAASTVLWPYLGGEIPTATAPDDKDEWRKRITSVLEAGAQVCFFDNVSRKLDSEPLASVLTLHTYSDRLLGKTKMLTLPNRTLWVVTGNQLVFSAEILRRRVPINLDAQSENPELRRGFKIDNLADFSRQNRPRQVWSILTIIQAWICAGKPTTNAHMGSFENFAKVMGGIMQVSGLDGFLSNLTTSPMANWVSLECVLEENAVSKMSDIIDACNKWRSERKFRCIQNQGFIKELKSVAPNVTSAQRRFSGIQAAAYLGIRLKTQVSAGVSSMLGGQETPENGLRVTDNDSDNNNLNAPSLVSHVFQSSTSRDRFDNACGAHTRIEGGQTRADTNDRTDEGDFGVADGPDGIEQVDRGIV